MALHRKLSNKMQRSPIVLLIKIVFKILHFIRRQNESMDKILPYRE